MRGWRLFFILSALVGIGYALFTLAVRQLADGFSPEKIASEISYSRAREVYDDERVHVSHILNQNFYYLEKGSQCYVFESEDGRYILKFFRHNRFRLPLFFTKFPLPSFLASIQTQKIHDKENKRGRLFESCLIAYNDLKEESALLYLHLNKTTHLKQTVVVYDKLQRPYSLEIDRYEFFIQRKGELLYPYLSQRIHEGRKKEAAQALHSIRTLFLSAFFKGIAHDDAVVPKNVGFYNGKAIFLDIGEFRRDPAQKNLQVIAQEMNKITWSLSQWLQAKDAALGLYLTKLNSAR